MFEVLLQADRALASGALDKAEQAYWQLVELDPTNAIAAAGLARVAMAKGDRRLARTFADKALSIDPENIAARDVVGILEGRGAAPVSHHGDLPLQAAQRLEAVGRKRIAAEEEEAGPERRGQAGPRGRAGAPAGPAGRQAGATSIPEMPRGEPLKERRQAGREVSTAAAAAAQAGPRPAQPAKRTALGAKARRHLAEPARIPPRANDAFSQAETAAAIEAVDEADEPVAQQAAVADSAAVARRASEAAQEEWAAAMAAAAAEGDAAAEAAETQADAAEAEEAQAAAAAAEAEAEAQAWTAAARPEAAEPAARPEAAEPAARPEAAEPAEPDDLEARLAAAELESEELAAAQEASSRIAEAEFEADVLEAVGMPGGRRRHVESGRPAANEATEEDAEAAALREAMDMVLGSEAEGTAGHPGPAPGSRASPEPAAQESPAVEPGKSAPAESRQDAQRRNGLLGKLRGD